jgi:hypothetical protein
MAGSLLEQAQAVTLAAAPVSPTKSISVNVADKDKIVNALEEQFPGLALWPEQMNVSCIFAARMTAPVKGNVKLYSSGKLVLTGGCTAFNVPN